MGSTFAYGKTFIYSNYKQKQIATKKLALRGEPTINA